MISVPSISDNQWNASRVGPGRNGWLVPLCQTNDPLHGDSCMPAIESREALRFVATGGVATLGNLATVAIARTAMPYNMALVCGIVVGMTLSFFLTKFFAFRARAWSGTSGEASRFLIVYCFGLLIYYLAAIQIRARLARFQIPPVTADLAGVLVGAGLMVVTGYFGHRFFTYRTNLVARRER